MSFKNMRLEFLELFDAEHIIDEESEIARYAVSDRRVTLTTYLSPDDGAVILSLLDPSSNIHLCEIRLSNVTEIKIDRGIPDEVRILFYKNDSSEYCAIVLMKPYIAINCHS